MGDLWTQCENTRLQGIWCAMIRGFSSFLDGVSSNLSKLNSKNSFDRLHQLWSIQAYNRAYLRSTLAAQVYLHSFKQHLECVKYSQSCDAKLERASSRFHGLSIRVQWSAQLDGTKMHNGKSGLVWIQWFKALASRSFNFLKRRNIYFLFDCIKKSK